jgi:hypothetical protein
MAFSARSVIKEEMLNVFLSRKKKKRWLNTCFGQRFKTLQLKFASEQKRYLQTHHALLPRAWSASDAI